MCDGTKRVEGIFDYDILLYGFLIRRQWGSFSWSFARISLLFIKWRRVEHKAARAWTFLVRLARSIPCAATYKLRCTLKKQEKKYIYVFFSANIPYFNFHINFQSSHLTKKSDRRDASKRLSNYCMRALNLEVSTLVWKTSMKLY